MTFLLTLANGFRAGSKLTDAKSFHIQESLYWFKLPLIMCKWHLLKCMRCGYEEYLRVEISCEWEKKGEIPGDAELFKIHEDEWKTNADL